MSEKLNMIVDDESGDYYVIPLDKRQAWEDMLYADEWNGDYPEWAHYVGGFAHCVAFGNWMKL